MAITKYLSGESDFFKGRRGRLKRYLVCSMQGYFPVLVKTGPQSLAVIYRTGGTHVSISATLAVSTSGDGGKSWSDPVEITPRWEDARNPAFGVNDSGELVAAFWKAEQAYGLCDGKIVWAGSEKRKKARGKMSSYTTISSDSGRTWSEPVPFELKNIKWGSPYGRIVNAPDGTMLMSFYGVEEGDGSGEGNTICIIRSKDGGITWGDESIVARGFNETSFAFMADGALVASARSMGGFVSVLFSKDNGYSWSGPEQITRKSEHPADLTLLQSGKLLMTYGRRLRPMGCGALVSEDSGKTWNTDTEVLLAGDGIKNTDLGYPSTVQLDDGTIVTVLYYASGSEMSDGHRGWGDVSCQAIHYGEKNIS